MLNAITIIVFAFSLLLMSFCLFERTKEGILLSVDNVIILGVAVVWGILFPIVYFYSLENQNNQYLDIISDYDTLDFILYYICVELFLLFFVQTFRFVSNKQYHNPFYIGEDIVNIVDDETDQLYTVSIIVFLVGVIADFLYCRAYGGYFGYLEYSAFIRSGVTNRVNNPWSFLIVFRDCVILSSYLLLAQIKKNNKVSFGRLVFFLISFVYSLMILYANKGRLSLAIYLVIIFSIHWIRKNKIEFLKTKHIFLILALSFAFMVVIGGISIIMDRSSGLELKSMFFDEISFCFANFKVLINEMGFGDLRLFVDIVSYPLFLLPSSLWRKIIPNTASDIMTIFVLGNKKGQGGVFGEIPIDAISIGYLQFGIIGVCLFAIFFGIVSAKLFNRISKFQNLDVRRSLYTYIMIDIFIRSLFYADSYNIVQRCFALVVFALIYFGELLSRKRTR